MKSKLVGKLFLGMGTLWCIALCAHATWHVWSTLAGPPSDETYANSVSFQLAAFGFTWLPMWLLSLCVLIPLAIVIKRQTTNNSAS